MTEPLTTPPPAAAPERDALLATKLHVPRPRAGFLARSRLLERLSQGVELELTLVCGPAGFGETTFAREALAQLTDEDRLLGSFVRYHLGMADWLAGRLADAERTLTGVVAERAAAGERYLAVRACHDLGQLQQAQGRLETALRTHRNAMELATEAGRPPLPATGMAQVGLAQVLYQRDELEAARQHATGVGHPCDG